MIDNARNTHISHEHFLKMIETKFSHDRSAKVPGHGFVRLQPDVEPFLPYNVVPFLPYNRLAALTLFVSYYLTPLYALVHHLISMFRICMRDSSTRLHRTSMMNL